MTFITFLFSFQWGWCIADTNNVHHPLFAKPNSSRLFTSDRRESIPVNLVISKKFSIESLIRQIKIGTKGFCCVAKCDCTFSRSLSDDRKFCCIHLMTVRQFILHRVNEDQELDFHGASPHQIGRGDWRRLSQYHQLTFSGKDDGSQRLLRSRQRKEWTSYLTVSMAGDHVQIIYQGLHHLQRAERRDFTACMLCRLALFSIRVPLPHRNGNGDQYRENRPHGLYPRWRVLSEYCHQHCKGSGRIREVQRDINKNKRPEYPKSNRRPNRREFLFHSSLQRGAAV